MDKTSADTRDQLIDRLNELNAIASRAYVTGDRRARRIAVEDADAIKEKLATGAI